MTDPITDMLNRIRNAQAVDKAEAVVPFSRLKFEIASLLAREGFVSDAKKAAKGKMKVIRMQLKYNNGVPGMEGARRVSKPGQRIYLKNKDIRRVQGGYGRVIVSTPKGLMTGIEAKKTGQGGEVLLEVW